MVSGPSVQGAQRGAASTEGGEDASGDGGGVVQVKKLG